MAKKTVAEINVKGKKVLMRVDFNVPLDKQQKITNDNRIVAGAADDQACAGQRRIADPDESPGPAGRRAGSRSTRWRRWPSGCRELLGKPVAFANDCVGPEVKAKAAALKPGDVLLLENVRFHPEEDIKDKVAKEDPKLRKAKDDFAKQLADLGDVYVDDAFGTAHRDNASMYTVPTLMKGKDRVIGFLIEKELKFLGETVRQSGRPFVAILGGAKVSDKLGVIENLMRKVNTILIGGAMAYTFFKAQGKTIGNSLCENDFVEKAKELLGKAKESAARSCCRSIP